MSFVTSSGWERPKAPAAAPTRAAAPDDGGAQPLAASFAAYCGIGFGATIVVLAVVLAVAWFTKRGPFAPRAPRPAAAAAAAEAKAAARPAPQPFLVVGPKRERLVAFAEQPFDDLRAAEQGGGIPALAAGGPVAAAGEAADAPAPPAAEAYLSQWWSTRSVTPATEGPASGCALPRTAGTTTGRRRAPSATPSPARSPAARRSADGAGVRRSLHWPED